MLSSAAATPLERQEQGRLQGQMRIASAAYAGNKEERMACAAAATPLERQEQGRLQGQIRIASAAYAGNKEERMARAAAATPLERQEQYRLQSSKGGSTKKGQVRWLPIVHVLDVNFLCNACSCDAILRGATARVGTARRILARRSARRSASWSARRSARRSAREHLRLTKNTTRG
jgi:hypothetical protein